MDLRLLGPVEACAAGVLLALGGSRQRSVLAALLLKSNEAVPTEQLLHAVLCNLAVRSNAIGEYERSLIPLDRQIAIARELGNQVGEIVGQQNLGEAYGHLGRAAIALAVRVIVDHTELAGGACPPTPGMPEPLGHPGS